MLQSHSIYHFLTFIILHHGWRKFWNLIFWNDPNPLNFTTTRRRRRWICHHNGGAGSCWYSQELWRHLGQILPETWFSRIYLFKQINLKQEIIIRGKKMLDLFWCRKDRWVRKYGLRDLKINTTSGMTASIKNLGKFGYVLKFAWDFRGTNMVKYRVGVFSLEKTRGIQ